MPIKPKQKKPLKHAPLKLIKPPLTSAESAWLITKPQIAYQCLLEGTADRSNVWDLWYRLTTTAKLAEHCLAVEGLDVERVKQELQDLFLSCPRHQVGDWGVSPQLLEEIGEVLEVAKIMQAEVNREIQARVYVWASQHMLALAKERWETGSTQTTGEVLAA